MADGNEIYVIIFTRKFAKRWKLLNGKYYVEKTFLAGK
jgi:hypothetical protein